MLRALGAGIIGGLAGSALAGLFLMVMHYTGTNGPFVTPLGLTARSVASDGLLGGWLVVLAIGAVLGAGFGLVARACRYRSDVVAPIGFFFSVVLWAVVSFAAIPALLGVTPVDVVRIPEYWPWLFGMLVPCIAFTSILAAVVLALAPDRRMAAAGSQDETLRRAA